MSLSVSAIRGWWSLGGSSRSTEDYTEQGFIDVHALCDEVERLRKECDWWKGQALSENELSRMRIKFGPADRRDLVRAGRGKGVVNADFGLGYFLTISADEIELTVPEWGLGEVDE